MKVQIIQLESHDDALSTRDKMYWSQTGHILLVWPPRGRILTRKLDLVLLKRHSKSLGVKLALVTNDSEVIHNADQLGLPVFEDERQALGSPWRSKRRRIVRIRREGTQSDLDTLRAQLKQNPGKWADHPGMRIFAFLTSITALLALSSLFIPNAILELSPLRKPQQIKMRVIGSPTFSKINIAGDVPLHTVTAIVEGKDSITTTGSMLFPDKYAIGGVRFTNLTEDEITIPEGTIVSTLGSNPSRFATTKSGKLFAGPGKLITLPTKAILPGEKGNVPAESILAIEGQLGLKIAATNPVPTHGGSDIPVPGASSKDKAALYAQLLSTLRETALAEFRNTLDEGDILIEETLELAEIIERNFDPPEGQPANSMELTLRLQFSAYSARRVDLENLANLVLDTNLPDRYVPIPQTLEIQHTGLQMQNEDGSYEWGMTLYRDTIAFVDEGNAINLILGLNVNQASQRLSEAFELKNTPDISIVPNWWPRLPYLPFLIQVRQSDTP